MCASRGKLAKLNYMEIKQLFDRKVIKNKRGTLTNGVIKLLVQQIHDHRREMNYSMAQQRERWKPCRRRYSNTTSRNWVTYPQRGKIAL
jgi:hypothetical protein